MTPCKICAVGNWEIRHYMDGRCFQQLSSFTFAVFQCGSYFYTLTTVSMLIKKNKNGAAQ